MFLKSNFSFLSATETQRLLADGMELENVLPPLFDTGPGIRETHSISLGNPK